MVSDAWARCAPIAIGPLDLTIESSDAAILARLVVLMGDFPPRHTSGRPALLRIESNSDGLGATDVGYTATLDGKDIATNSDLRRLEERITRVLNRTVLDEEPHVVHLHAGAVTRDGVTVLVVGRSMSGKSTLVAKLVTNGWTYLSDEQLGVTSDGRVIAYQRPITLRRKSWTFFAGVQGVPDDSESHVNRVEVPASDLGSVYSGDAIAPTIVVRPDVSGDNAGVYALTVAETVSVLVTDTLDLERAGQQGIDSLIAVAEAAPGFRIAGRDLDATCAEIETLAASVVAPGRALRQDRTTGDELSQRLPTTEAWLFADRSAVVYDHASGVLAQLDEPGYDAWVHLGRQPPDQPAELAGSTFVAELVAAGLLRPE